MEKSLSIKIDSLAESYGIDPDEIISVDLHFDNDRLVITWETDG